MPLSLFGSRGLAWACPAERPAAASASSAATTAIRSFNVVSFLMLSPLVAQIGPQLAGRAPSLGTRPRQRAEGRPWNAENSLKGIPSTREYASRLGASPGSCSPLTGVVNRILALATRAAGAAPGAVSGAGGSRGGRIWGSSPALVARLGDVVAQA